jgi:RNA polymerase sigma-70 factor (ECF subfamily)
MNKLDHDTFEKLFKELYPFLCRHSIQFVRQPEIAEEIVQEQFIYLWEKRNELCIHTSFTSYLYAAVKNKSINYLQSKFAKIQYLHEEYSYELKENADPYSIIEDQELTEIISKAMDLLPKKCYIIFSMRRFGDFTNKQIARALNISEKTVENQITIAFKKLRPILVKSILLVCLIFFP